MGYKQTRELLLRESSPVQTLLPTAEALLSAAAAAAGSSGPSASAPRTFPESISHPRTSFLLGPSPQITGLRLQDANRCRAPAPASPQRALCPRRCISPRCAARFEKKKKINPPKQTLPLHVWLLPPGETERETEPHVTDVNRII